MRKSLLIFSLITLAGVSAFSAELRQPYRPVSALGMGGVYIPFPDDPDAPIVNPAALRWVSGLHIDFAEIDVGLNYNYLDQSTRTFLDAVQAIPDTNDYGVLYGKPIWVGARGKLGVALPYFGVGGYLNTFISTQLNNPAFPDLDITYMKDQVISAGFAIPMGPMSSLGLGVKQINRFGGEKEIDLGIIASGAQVNTLINQFQDAGVGYGIDVAWMTRLPLPLLEPTFTAMWQDLGSVKFAKTAGENPPAIQKDNLMFGAGFLLDLPGLDIRSGLEYRHVNLQGEQLGKKIHAGVELSLPLIDLRMGANQGYSTFGVGLDMWLFRFDAAMTTEELGAYPGQTPQTRYMASFGLSLSLDPDFNVSKDGGKSRSRRKLKQRR